jgi:DNA-binding MarR family transcriptional regulator
MNRTDNVSNIGTELAQLALWNHRFERELALGEDIPVNELHCVIQIYLQKPVSAGVLAESLGIRATSLSKLLRNLESRDLIARKTTAEDRRVERIGLTAAGMRLAGRVYARAGAIGAHLIAGLPEERREQFVRCLSIVTATKIETLVEAVHAEEELHNS